MDVCMYFLSAKTKEGFDCKKSERRVGITERFAIIEQIVICIVLHNTKTRLTNTTFGIYSK